MMKMRGAVLLSCSVMTMRLLVWPESSDGSPFEQKEPGWVVGWKIDDTTVVAAGILCESLDDDDADVATNTMIVGRWQPKNDESLEKNPKLTYFCSTPDGPWWKDAPAEPSQQEQLLLYRRENVCYHCNSDWMSGLFPKLLWYMNEADAIMKQVAQGESIDVENHIQDDGSYSRDKGEQDGEAAVEKESSLPRRFGCFVAKHSMLALHWHDIRGFFYRIPFVQLLSLEQIRDDDKLSRQVGIDAYMERFNETVSVSLNMVLGISIGLLLLYHVNQVQTLLQHTWKACYQELLRDNIQWLETFPAGFKLNVPLTQNMGREIIMLIGVYDTICTLLWSLLSQVLVLKAVAVTSIVFGFTALIALLHDMLILSTLHIAIVATCFRVMHQTQLYLLASLWRLFRGRKQNILRHRTDTMEYDSMQLLLGMILFTAVLFLFTTILVYYMFFAVLYLAIQGTGVVLWLTYVMARFVPLGKCLLRAQHPGWFTEQVYLGDVVSETRTVTRIVPVYESFGSILSAPLTRHFAPLISSIPCFLGQVLTGSPCTIRQVCLSSSSWL